MSKKQSTPRQPGVKKRWLDLVMALLFVAGVGIMVYPFINDSLNHLLEQRLVSYYQQQANNENAQKLAALKQEMAAKNAQLQESGNNPGVDQFTAAVEEGAPVQKTSVDFFEIHTIGALYIPSIEVKLPIFDQTNDLLLQKGVSLLEGTSYPVGGTNTHAVLSAHRGLPEATLFTNLPQVKMGEQFYIDINQERLAYEVNDIRVIEPTETEYLQIKSGQDLVTLMTCTPYMINTQRLLVTGVRVPYVAASSDKVIKAANVRRDLKMSAWLVATCLGILGFLIWLSLFFYQGALAKVRRDLSFNVCSQETGQGLGGIKFYLKTKNGKKHVYRDGQPLCLVSDDNGRVTLNELRGGQYTVVLDRGNRTLAPVFKIKLKSLKQPHFSFSLPRTQARLPVSEIRGEWTVFL